ncbi:MAG TPA: hypothetical protein VMF91_04225 [Bryobacteraceae bacterium]|nr:hypothetical protein [Bryobacteraceae bacterium]
MNQRTRLPTNGLTGKINIKKQLQGTPNKRHSKHKGKSVRQECKPPLIEKIEESLQFSEDLLPVFDRTIIIVVRLLLAILAFIGLLHFLGVPLQEMRVLFARLR